jgi:hypothetical protein
LIATFVVGRLLRRQTWTAGWRIGGATAPVRESISWTLGSRQCAGAWLGSSEFIVG